MSSGTLCSVIENELLFYVRKEYNRLGLNGKISDTFLFLVCPIESDYAVTEDSAWAPLIDHSATETDDFLGMIYPNIFPGSPNISALNHGLLRKVSLTS